MLWILASICACLGVRQISVALPRSRAGAALRPDGVVAALHGLQESIEAGVVPPGEAWDGLEGLPAPWGRLCSESVRGLRAGGAPVLPTLRRLRAAAESARDRESRSRARASQSLGQALFS